MITAAHGQPCSITGMYVARKPAQASCARSGSHAQASRPKMASLAGLVSLVCHHSAVPATAASRNAPLPHPPDWHPLWDRQGVCDMGCDMGQKPCEATPLWLLEDRQMYLMEGICYRSDFGYGSHASPFLQPSEVDTVAADQVMRSAAENQRTARASLSFPFRGEWVGCPSFCSAPGCICFEYNG